MTKKPHHVAEVFENFPPDWQMRKRYRPEDFEQVLKTENVPFIETYHEFMRGAFKPKTISARIAADTPYPFKWPIKFHSGTPGGLRDWQDKPLGSFEGPWGRHFERCALDYWEATDWGTVTCHEITQTIRGLHRRYFRLILPLKGQVLVASQEVPSHNHE